LLDILFFQVRIAVKDLVERRPMSDLTLARQSRNLGEESLFQSFKPFKPFQSFKEEDSEAENSPQRV
jgi:hypothetical protein